MSASIRIASLLAWQRNYGAGVSPVAAVPEPASWLLCCVALGWLRRRQVAVLCIVTAAAMVTQVGSAAELTLTRQSRLVTAAEAADGAPTGGIVHDFVVTSDADLITLIAYTNVSLYQHPYGSDNAIPHPSLAAYFPAIAADSFLRMPSATVMLGGGFDGPGPERLWADLVNDGPQTNFLFGRLTTVQTGSFSGDFYLRGNESYVKMPFSFTLPDTPGVGSEQLTLFGIEQGQSAYTPLDAIAMMSEINVIHPRPVLTPVIWPTVARSAMLDTIQRKNAWRSGFTAVSAVPEPASWLLGLVLLGYVVGARSRSP